MIKRIAGLMLLAFSLSIGVSAADDYDPVADPAAVVKSGKMRFTVLTPQMIRIQYSSLGKFEDRATFGVVNRRLPVPEYSVKRENGYLYITTSVLTLKYKIGTVPLPTLKNSQRLSITFDMNGSKVLWYPGKDDALNLKGTTRTLDGCIGDSKRSELEDGLLSRGGWAIVDESPQAKRGDGSTSFAFDGKVNGVPWLASQVDPNAYDWYFLGYGHDYKKALGDYVKIGGRINMPPLYILGYWYSKYQKYTQQDFIDLVTEIKKNDIPIDVMIFDMDWHKDGWTGWSWNKSIIPDPEGLIKWMHSKQLKVSLNLHPADGISSYEDHFLEMCSDIGLPDTTKNIPWALEDSTFAKAFFRNIIRNLEKQGVDFWWIDWQQTLTRKFQKGILSNTFWINHTFYNDMKNTYPDKRPVIFHRWGGLGSHRYPLGFSGDTHSTFGTLAFEPYFTATASNVGFGYWGHDLGGHQYNPRKNNDPELYLRWMQYGVFSPVFRTHASSNKELERRIWVYPNFRQLLETVNLRYAMMPYIYTAAREAYDTGISICRPLYYDYPEENKAYRYEDEYMFGNDILVAPVVTPSQADGLARRKVWLPEGSWYDVCRNSMVEGNREFTGEYTQPEIPYFLKAGSILVNNPHVWNLKTTPDTLIVNVIPGGDGSYSLYEDEGDNDNYQKGVFTRTLFEQKRTDDRITLSVNPRTGSFPGMKTKRTYKVVFKKEAKPLSVALNGNTLAEDKWSYDEASRTLSLYVDSADCSALTTVTVERDKSAGVPALMSEESMQVKYLPEASVVRVKAGSRVRSLRIELTDSEGKCLVSASDMDTKSCDISAAGLSQGVYICNVNADGRTVSMKFVK